MKETRLIMGMPITVEIVCNGKDLLNNVINEVFEYFNYVDKKFSVYKEDSEISQINNGLLEPRKYSSDMNEILDEADRLRLETNGYFDIRNRNGILDPSGIVKGWAIYNAGNIVKKYGLNNYYINAGGDIEVGGLNAKNTKWIIGIENPFKQGDIIKTVYLTNCGIATSGTYLRGQHIYNPMQKNEEINEIVSLTVIGPNIYEADRFSTPAFAMGKQGIYFLEKQKGLEGYIIDSNGIATMTSGFEKYTFAC